jgi:selenocysteine lyase/cysteine desulfurase
MMEIYNHHFNNDNLSIREKIIKINKLISEHEEKISNPILEYFYKRDDLNLIGKIKIKNKNRAPTISFTSKLKSSKKISEILVANLIATRNDNFYAWRCLKALNIDTDDGLVRLSMTHYNTEEDTKNLINALEKI